MGEELNELSKKKKEIVLVLVVSYDIIIIDKKKKTDIMEIKTEEIMERQMIALMKDVELNVVGCDVVVCKIQSVLQQHCRKKLLKTSLSGTQLIIYREDREVREEERKLSIIIISYEKKDEKNENDSMSVVIRLILLGFVLVLISSEAGEKPKQRKNSILTLELFIFSLFYPLLILSFLKKKEMRK